jgi:hypothetical protein
MCGQPEVACFFKLRDTEDVDNLQGMIEVIEGGCSLHIILYVKKKKRLKKI